VNENRIPIEKESQLRHNEFDKTITEEEILYVFFTTELIKLLVEKNDFTEFFRSKVEEVVNKFLETELTCLLNCERYDREGFNTGKSRKVCRPLLGLDLSTHQTRCRRQGSCLLRHGGYP